MALEIAINKNQKVIYGSQILKYFNNKK